MQLPPGFIRFELTFFLIGIFVQTVSFLYESLAVARFGRTVGKAALHIRPLRLDGSTLTLGRSFGRAGTYLGFGLLGGLGAIDPAWCLWDPIRQCLHDKIAETIVVRDR